MNKWHILDAEHVGYKYVSYQVKSWYGKRNKISRKEIKKIIRFK